MDYKDRLDRAFEKMDDELTNEKNRFDPPDPTYEIDGNFTVFRNIKSTAKYLNRDVNELFTFVKEELATNGSMNEERARFKGDFNSEDLQNVVNKFVDSYVICKECKSPDTKYIERAGVEVIKCTACGATRPKSSE